MISIPEPELVLNKNIIHIDARAYHKHVEYMKRKNKKAVSIVRRINSELERLENFTIFEEPEFGALNVSQNKVILRIKMTRIYIDLVGPKGSILYKHDWKLKKEWSYKHKRGAPIWEPISFLDVLEHKELKNVHRDQILSNLDWFSQ